MNVNGHPYRTVWMEKGAVKMIDQTLLPHTFKIISLPTHIDTAKAIFDMKIRGAGAIGGAAGYGLAQAVLEAPEDNFLDYVKKGKENIEKTRPTARNLFYATNRIFDAIQGTPHTEAKTVAVREAQAIADEDQENCRNIGLHGAKLIQDGCTIQTHCNAGWLAFVDHGTSLSPIYHATREGKNVFVYVNETRPRGQGSLTAWELSQENVPHVIIADTAAGSLMQRGKTDIVITGADRIASSGDTANKIGTYQLAVLAKENNIPFYVAAPTTTIDFEIESGSQIPIEERSEDEVLFMWGKNDKGEFERVRIAPEGSRALNLAFDVTPAKLITGIITEKGIFKPDELHKLKPHS